MTDVLIPVPESTTWYKPEFPPDSITHTCYCHKPAYGRTRYWDGARSVYKYQCREHIPAEAVRAVQP